VGILSAPRLTIGFINMTTLTKALIAGPSLACLLAAGEITLQASGTTNAGSDQETKAPVLTLSLDSMDGLEVQSIRENGLEPVKTTVDLATYQGRRALREINDPGVAADGTGANAQILAIVKASDFKDGTIEADVVGLPRQGAPLGTPGFVGIAFHVQDHGTRYEAFYLRPRNSRLDDQLRRNHSTQYVSRPGFPWRRLREENPGVYESYVDLNPNAWTRIKIVVAGTTAKLYINGVDQPCLIVNDLKLGDTHGQVALFSASDTDAYFSNLVVR
jgi:hypothetical protein